MVLSNHSHNVTMGEQVNQSEPASDLGSLAMTSYAAKTVFHALASRVRFRRTTDLNRLYRFIVAEIDENFTEEQFLGVFKTLGTMELGKLIIGRKNNPNRFRWYYNLREAASVALDNKPMSQLAMLPRKPRTTVKPKATRKRRRKSSVKPTFTPYVPPQAETPASVVSDVPSVPSAPGIVININLPANANPDEVKALVDLAKTLTT